MDFSQEDLLDACDRLVSGLLERAGVTEPPVDALRVAEDHLGIPVEVAEPEEDERGRPRASSRRRPTAGIVLSPQMSEEQQQAAAAHGIARTLLPDLLHKLDIAPGSESKPAAAHFRGLLAARVLVPTRLLRSALRHCKYDLPALKDVFATASFETVALRLLDLDDPCVIAIVDDGVVATRRGNTLPVTKKLTPAEQECHDRVSELDLPHRVRTGGWTVHGWPVPDRPFRRVVLRGVPDDV
jgi:predicted transcriptional regulator